MKGWLSALRRVNTYAGCQWSSDCQSERAKRGRSISRDEHAERREQFAEKMSRVESQEAYKRRFHAAETPFAVLKQIMKLRQFLLRGLENVKTEWLWACTAHNLRKLIREIGRLRAEFHHLATNGEG